MKRHRWLTALTLSSLCVALSACAQSPGEARASPGASAPNSPAPTAETEAQRLTHELRGLIEPATCTRDAQCATLGVGAKACGGPAGYWAWAPASANAERVRATAARLADAQRQEIEARGLRSNCSVVIDPGAVCTAGRCETRPASAAADSAR